MVEVAVVAEILLRTHFPDWACCAQNCGAGSRRGVHDGIVAWCSEDVRDTTGFSFDGQIGKLGGGATRGRGFWLVGATSFIRSALATYLSVGMLAFLRQTFDELGRDVMIEQNHATWVIR